VTSPGHYLVSGVGVEGLGLEDVHPGYFPASRVSDSPVNL